LLSRLVGSVFSDLNFLKNDLLVEDNFFANLIFKTHLLPIKTNKLIP